MHYISTRGEAPELAFDDVLLAGLAADGGLYVPKTYPAVARGDIAALAGLPYDAAAARLIEPFAGEIGAGVLREATRAAYAGFSHRAVAPLTQIDDNLFVLELFHGPTLAFKDLAMQLLGRLMNHVLEQRGLGATIVGATSGDTGAAAIEAFRGQSRVDVFILYPDGRVSDVQRRQMTTVADDNIHAIALRGTFDDAQSILKSLFRDGAYRERLGLAGVNSINWARVVAQMVYYFTSAVALGAPFREVSFAVPTGNFGDVLAGYVAKRMGLPLSRLIVATNANDILARALASGRYEPRGVTPTQSPSMDIQLSSNFERLLFDALGRDAGGLARGFRQSRPIGRLRYSARGAGLDSSGFRRARGQRSGNQRRDRPHLSRVGLCARPAHGDGGSRRAGAARDRSFDAGRGAGDRASGEISRRDRARHRRAHRPAAAARANSYRRGAVLPARKR